MVQQIHSLPRPSRADMQVKLHHGGRETNRETDREREIVMAPWRVLTIENKSARDQATVTGLVLPLSQYYSYANLSLSHSLPTCCPTNCLVFSTRLAIRLSNPFPRWGSEALSSPPSPSFPPPSPSLDHKSVDRRRRRLLLIALPVSVTPATSALSILPQPLLPSHLVANSSVLLLQAPPPPAPPALARLGGDDPAATKAVAVLLERKKEMGTAAVYASSLALRVRRDDDDDAAAANSVKPCAPTRTRETEQGGAREVATDRREISSKAAHGKTEKE